MECDMRELPERASIRLGMIKIIDIETSPKARGFGFRFETRHENSKHDYMHAQVTINPFVNPLPGCPPWIPVHIPCIPTTADNVVTLLFCLLISLYGKRTLGEMITDMQVAEKYIKPVREIIS